MPVHSLGAFEDDGTRMVDLVIVGAGACGLTLARRLAAPGRRILVLESGGAQEDADHEALNAVTLADGSLSSAEIATRDRYHGTLARHWSGTRQQFGVRCRGLGGSTIAWAGKCAPVEPLDMAARAWVPGSGWPIDAETLAPYLDAAAQSLGLGGGSFDAAHWDRLSGTPPAPQLDGGAFRAMFWKFARSHRNPAGILTVGEDWTDDPPPGIEVITDATVTALDAGPDGGAFRGLTARSLSGRTLRVTAPTCVLAAGAIENPRLLLISDAADPAGLGNTHDRVGRGLVDHPTAVIARFDVAQAGPILARFGLRGWREGGRTHVCMQGLAFDPDWQREARALAGAIFVGQQPAEDDPFSAARRLARRQSASVPRDVLAVLRGPGRLAMGAAMRAAERGAIPRPITAALSGLALRVMPNRLALFVQGGSLPRKLAGLWVEATTEQPAHPENRVTLSTRRDAFGLPCPKVHWNPGPQARDNLLRLGQAFRDAMRSRPGLPQPKMEPWVEADDPAAAVTIDLGHPMGTTRMSDKPQDGVVDRDCQVHGIAGLYAAGGSVLPGSGHANPTLTMLAVTLRLADHLDARLSTGPSVP